MILISPLSLTTDVTDVILGASDHWLGTQTGTGDTVILAYIAAAHGSMDNRLEFNFSFKSKHIFS